MADIYRTLDPALEAQNASGQVILGPICLAPRSPTGTVGQRDYGVSLHSCDVEYPDERLGSWFNAAYDKRWTLLGYRPIITLDFSLVVDDSSIGNKGLSLLRTFHDFSLRSGEGLSVWFNAFGYNADAESGASPWRRVHSIAVWAPKKAGNVQGVGWELTMKFECVYLVPSTAVGDFRAHQW